MLAAVSQPVGIPESKAGGIRAKRKDLNKRRSQLWSDRASWDSHWRDISRVLLPRNGRFFVTDNNRGERRHNDIYDSTGTRALRTLASGLMAGATSPARPWFTLTTTDPDLAKYYPVKEWLDDTANRIMRVFGKSNTYRALHQVYEEMGAFGTAASMLLPDLDNVIHHYPVTVGEYAIQQDFRGVVNTFYREFQITVGQCVREFGLEMCTEIVKTHYRNGNLDAPVVLVHAIEPREDRDPTKADRLNMPFRSCYFERDGNEEKVLRESGYRRFPVLVPRWAVTGGDVYGHSPGMESLGDIRQLQHEQLRKGEVIDYQTKPPVQVPVGGKNREVDMLPGGVSYYDLGSGANGGIKTAFEVNLRLDYLLEDIRDVRQRINETFFADLFLMISNANDTTQRTAAEIAARNEEKLVMLGPVSQRLHNELLEPMIDLTFDILWEAGEIAPPPDELAGMDLGIEFVSVLAQAQRAVGTAGMDRLAMAVGSVAQMKQDVLDRFDADAWVDEYATMLGTPPNVLVPLEKVAEIRRARAEAEKAKEQAAMMQQQAQTTRDLAAAPTNEQNALTDVMSGLTGYSTPQQA